MTFTLHMQELITKTTRLVLIEVDTEIISWVLINFSSHLSENKRFKICEFLQIIFHNLDLAIHMIICTLHTRILTIWPESCPTTGHNLETLCCILNDKIWNCSRWSAKKNILLNTAEKIASLLRVRVLFFHKFVYFCSLFSELIERTASFKMTLDILPFRFKT